MMDVGRICTKIAGRDAGQKCVIVDVIDDKFVLIDGQARRRKCNIRHLEPSVETLSLKKGAAHSEVVSVFKKLGIEIVEKKPRQPTKRPVAIRAFDRKKQLVKSEKPVAVKSKSASAEKTKKPVSEE